MDLGPSVFEHSLCQRPDNMCIIVPKVIFECTLCWLFSRFVQIGDSFREKSSEHQFLDG